MKNLYLAFLSILLLFANECFAQESKLEKFLGEGFYSIPAVNRGYSDLCDDCTLRFTQRYMQDTSGIVYNNNYVLFRNYVTDSVIVGKSFAYFHELPVSNAEFQEFQSWVRDSLARKRILEARSSSEEDIAEFLIIDPKIPKSDRLGIENIENLKKSCPLNWNKKFSYNDPDLIPCLSDLYLPPVERFYRKREFDSRKYVYEHNEKWGDGRNLENRTTLITYPESFALESKSKFSETNVLAQLYELQYPEMPILTFCSAQARAFCQWKQEQLQKELNIKHLDYKVTVTLPLNSELRSEQTALAIPAKDYTENWRIIVQEYQEFLNAVRDSIVLENLYKIADNAQAQKMLDYEDYYYSEIDGEMKEFDPSDQIRNRELFAFRAMSTVYKKNKRQIDSLRSELSETEINFKYWAKDLARMAIIGTPTYVENEGHFYARFPWDSLGDPIGKTQQLGWYNRLRHINDALGNENLSLFFYRYVIENVIPTIPLNQQPVTEIVQGISYDQALAYYNWKFPISKAGSTQNWQNFAFPTKEQFEAIQRGESIVIPQHQLAYPVPTFHYVVQFTEKK